MTPMRATFPDKMPAHCMLHALEASEGDEGDRIVCDECGTVWKVKNGRWKHPFFLYRWLIEWWWLA